MAMVNHMCDVQSGAAYKLSLKPGVRPNIVVKISVISGKKFVSRVNVGAMHMLSQTMWPQQVLPEHN